MAMFNGIYAPDQPLQVRPRQTLGDMLNEISQAQRARQMDELRLKQAQMSLADVERKRADEMAYRAALSEPVPEEMPAATNPRIGPPVIEPTSNAQRLQVYAQRLMKLGRVDEATRLLEAIPKMTPKTPSGYTPEERMAIDSHKYELIMQAKKMDIEAAALRVQQTAQFRDRSREDAQAHETALANLRGAIARYNTPSRMIEGEEGYVGADPFARGPINRAGGEMLPPQPVAPAPGAPLPAAMPPGIRTPNPSNMGSDVPPGPPPALPAGAQESIAMDVGSGVGTSPVSPDMAPAPTAGSSTVDLFREPLRSPTKTPDVGREVNNILGAIKNNPDLKRFEPVNVVASKLESEFSPEMVNPDGSYTRAVTSPGIQDNILLQQFLSAFDPKVGIIRPAEIEKFMAQYSFPVRMSQMALKTGLGQGYDEGGIGEMVAVMTPSMRRSMLDAMNRLLSKATEQMAPAYSEALNSTTSEAAKSRVRSSIPAVIRRALEKGPTPTAAPSRPNSRKPGVSGGVGLTGAPTPAPVGADDPANPDFWK